MSLVTDTQNARILVAEDDRAVRESLARALQLEGYGVVAAHNGAEALDAIGQAEPDVLLLDVSMPSQTITQTIMRLEVKLYTRRSRHN